jgi:hypothetical protein
MKRGLILAMIVFCLGWAASSLVMGVEPVPEERPGFLHMLEPGATERISPDDRIKEHQIKVYNDKVVIELEGAQWASFTDTNSMDPVIDDGVHAIEIIPLHPDEVHVGDIMSYESTLVDGTIIHRVVETGYDEEGWYAIMKGDNLRNRDPERVRFNQVRRIVVAIIY